MNQSAGVGITRPIINRDIYAADSMSHLVAPADKIFVISARTNRCRVCALVRGVSIIVR
jgi:hypothetical protein